MGGLPYSLYLSFSTFIILLSFSLKGRLTSESLARLGLSSVSYHRLPGPVPLGSIITMDMHIMGLVSCCSCLQGQQQKYFCNAYPYLSFFPTLLSREGLNLRFYLL